MPQELQQIYKTSCSNMDPDNHFSDKEKIPYDNSIIQLCKNGNREPNFSQLDENTKNLILAISGLRNNGIDHKDFLKNINILKENDNLLNRSNIIDDLKRRAIAELKNNPPFFSFIIILMQAYLENYLVEFTFFEKNGVIKFISVDTHGNKSTEKDIKDVDGKYFPSQHFNDLLKTNGKADLSSFKEGTNERRLYEAIQKQISDNFEKPLINEEIEKFISVFEEQFNSGKEDLIDLLRLASKSLLMIKGFFEYESNSFSSQDNLSNSIENFKTHLGRFNNEDIKVKGLSLAVNIGLAVIAVGVAAGIAAVILAASGVSFGAIPTACVVGGLILSGFSFSFGADCFKKRAESVTLFSRGGQLAQTLENEKKLIQNSRN